MKLEPTEIKILDRLLRKLCQVIIGKEFEGMVMFEIEFHEGSGFGDWPVVMPKYQAKVR